MTYLFYKVHVKFFDLNDFSTVFRISPFFEDILFYTLIESIIIIPPRIAIQYLPPPFPEGFMTQFHVFFPLLPISL